MSFGNLRRTVSVHARRSCIVRVEYCLPFIGGILRMFGAIWLKRCHSWSSPPPITAELLKPYFASRSRTFESSCIWSLTDFSVSAR